MQYKTFSIPATSSDSAEEQLNAFLRSNKIISVQKEFISSPCQMWCFLVEYMAENALQKTGGKIDYMKILSQEDFALFSKLREIRKKIAAEEKLPAYAVFTDEQLANLVKTKPETIESMQKINGIGSMKAEKYGAEFLKALAPSQNSKQNDTSTQKNAEFDIF